MTRVNLQFPVCSRPTTTTMPGSTTSFTLVICTSTAAKCPNPSRTSSRSVMRWTSTRLVSCVSPSFSMLGRIPWTTARTPWQPPSTLRNSRRLIYWWLRLWYLQCFSNGDTTVLYGKDMLYYSKTLMTAPPNFKKPYGTYRWVSARKT